MAKVLVSESNLTNIANAIRAKNESSNTYTPAQMANAILAIQTGVEPWEINITQSANQTISVNTFLSKTGTSSYLFGESTDVPTVLTTITPSTGYNAGTASVQRSGSTFSVSATAATLIDYTITITQSEHQTITVICNGVSHTTSFTAHYGDTWTATIVADEGYTAGTLSESSGTITQDITISASSAQASVPEGIVDFAIVGAGKYIHESASDVIMVGYCEDEEGFTTEKAGSINSANNTTIQDYFVQQWGAYMHVFQTSLSVQDKYINVCILTNGDAIIRSISNVSITEEQVLGNGMYQYVEPLETKPEDIFNLPNSAVPIYFTIISENELSDEDVRAVLNNYLD